MELLFFEYSRTVLFRHIDSAVCNSALPDSVLQTGQPGACPNLKGPLLVQIIEKAQLPAFQTRNAEAACSAQPASPGRQLEQTWNIDEGFTSDAPAPAESSPPVRKQVPHLALLAPEMPAAAKSPPPALPARPTPEQTMRSDSQV